MRLLRLLAALACPLAAFAPATGADWPTWRADAGRTCAVPDGTLADTLHLQWVRRLPPQRTAWRDEEGMKFDAGYLPVAMGGRLFVGSTVTDSVTAYELAGGGELWRFYAGGPVRFAPAGWAGRLFVASDDGLLYCLRAADGRVLWSFRGGVRDRRLIGNERVISTWPARGGPVVAPDPDTGRPIVYFAAGVWPFMGVFVHALDAETGRVLWTNDSASFNFRRMPHPGATSLTGLSAQGHLAAVGDKLIVPGSASSPGVFDRRTGKFLAYADGTGPSVCGRGRFAFAGGEVFEAHTGYRARFGELRRAGLPVLAEGAWYVRDAAFDPATATIREVTIQVPETTRPDGPTYPKQVFDGEIARRGDGKRTQIGTPWLLAGAKLVTTGRVASAKVPKDHTSVQVVDVSAGVASARVCWQTNVEGAVSDIMTAGGRLVVVTLDGAIRCFGDEGGDVKSYAAPEPGKPAPNAWADRAEALLAAAGPAEGYALVLGLTDGGLVEELLRRTALHVVAVDADAGRVEGLRRRLDAAGLYGTRAAAIVGDPAAVRFAPYLASLIVSEDASRAGPPAGLFEALRPYGGAACLALSDEQHVSLARAAEQGALDGADVRRAGALSVLRRPGPPPGAADWLGQNADAGNTRFSRDERVRLPLGVLWFGNALSNSLVLPRHGEGPVEQVVGGRLFIEGPDSLSAVDVYTGRPLWTREFPGLGRYFALPKHQRGAHAVGGNFFATADAVYVAAGEACCVLDPADGRTRKQFRLPARPGETKRSEWLFLVACEDLLIAGAEPLVTGSGTQPRYNTPASSGRLVGMDGTTGAVQWTRRAAGSFGHYAIVAGRGKVFCVDRASSETEAALARRGEEPTLRPVLYALDARTGRVVWRTERCVGRALSYSAEDDVLLADGALRGESGEVIWEARKPPEDEEIDPARGPAVEVGLKATGGNLWWGKWGPMIHGRTIYTQQQRAFDLLTGALRTWKDAAGQLHAWRFPRGHGCGPMAGSRHLLTFRSGCAGFFDLAGDGGTGNLGGFRSGCTSNLVAAGGVLNAPDYTRTCGCDYQNRSSLALVHMPEVEYWTFGAVPAVGKMAYNFGAPGDRRAEDGTLWQAAVNPADVHYKRKPLVAIAPAAAEAYYHHSSRCAGRGAPAWVAASGVEGLRSAVLPLGFLLPGRPVRVRLHFADPTHAEAGRRVFSVFLDGRRVLEDLDIAKESGGRFRGLVRDLGPLPLPGGESLTLTFTAKAGRALICGVELVQE